MGDRQSALAGLLFDDAIRPGMREPGDFCPQRFNVGKFLLVAISLQQRRKHVSRAQSDVRNERG